jgi:hypothetical protein
MIHKRKSTHKRRTTHKLNKRSSTNKRRNYNGGVKTVKKHKQTLPPLLEVDEELSLRKEKEEEDKYVMYKGSRKLKSTGDPYQNFLNLIEWRDKMKERKKYRPAVTR